MNVAKMIQKVLNCAQYWCEEKMYGVMIKLGIAISTNIHYSSKRYKIPLLVKNNRDISGSQSK